MNWNFFKKNNPKSAASPTQDVLQNAILKIGDTSKLAQGSYSNDLYFTRNWIQLNGLYRSNWLTQKIVNLISDDMTRAWLTRTSQQTAPADMERVKQFEKKLCLKTRLNQAVKWGRLYGGCLLFLDFGGTSDPAKPVDPRTVSIGGLKAIQVIDRWRVLPSSELVNDISDPEYGLPLYYIFEGKKLHYTRCVRVVPVELPWIESYRENHWGASVLEAPFNCVLKYDSISSSGIELAFLAQLRHISVEGLREAAGTKKFQSMIQAYQQLSDLASNLRISLIDKLDDLKLQNYTFAGFSDMMINYMVEMSGASEIPLTKLWGETVKGLNNAGEGDLTHYYDSINTKQEAQLRLGIEKIYSYMIPSVLGVMPLDFGFEFDSLWQMSDKDAADAAFTQAQADNIYLTNHVLSASTIAKELKERKYYKNITEAELEEKEPQEPETV